MNTTTDSGAAMTPEAVGARSAVGTAGSAGASASAVVPGAAVTAAGAGAAALASAPGVTVTSGGAGTDGFVPARRATVTRTTKETSITVELALEPGPVSVSTGIGFLDHMLTSLAFHGGLTLQLICKGDLQVDDHHSAEDSALALGEALRLALGDRAGIVRFGTGFAPLDESLARAVVDLSGRPYCYVDLGLVREKIGDLAAENVEHVFASLASASMMTLHLDVIRGRNDHHRAEAAFKALALALRQAVALRQSAGAAIPSTKGMLTAASATVPSAGNPWAGAGAPAQAHAPVPQPPSPGAGQ